MKYLNRRSILRFLGLAPLATVTPVAANRNPGLSKEYVDSLMTYEISKSKLEQKRNLAWVAREIYERYRSR